MLVKTDYSDGEVEGAGLDFHEELRMVNVELFCPIFILNSQFFILNSLPPKDLRSPLHSSLSRRVLN